MRRRLFIKLAGLSTLLIMLLPAAASALSSSDLISLTNQQRTGAGLQPLTTNSELMASAHAKAMDMLAHDYWAHYSPTGTSPWYWFTASGYHFSRAGENLAMDFSSDTDLMAGWMASPAHRANILNPYYREIGIAVVNGTLQGHQTILVVAHYGTPSGAPASAIARPQTVKNVAKPAVLTAAPQPAAVPVAATPQLTADLQPEAQAPTTNWAQGLLKLSLIEVWLVPLLRHQG